MWRSSPTTTRSPSQPRSRSASAARRPASEAPTTTAGAPATSVEDRDGGDGAGLRGPLDLLAQRLVGLGLVLEDVVVVELEDLGRGEAALAVRLAQIHVHLDLHGTLSSFGGPGRVAALNWIMYTFFDERQGSAAHPHHAVAPRPPDLPRRPHGARHAGPELLRPRRPGRRPAARRPPAAGRDRARGR